MSIRAQSWQMDTDWPMEVLYVSQPLAPPLSAKTNVHLWDVGVVSSQKNHLTTWWQVDSQGQTHILGVQLSLLLTVLSCIPCVNLQNNFSITIGMYIKFPNRTYFMAKRRATASLMQLTVLIFSVSYLYPDW